MKALRTTISHKGFGVMRRVCGIFALCVVLVTVFAVNPTPAHAIINPTCQELGAQLNVPHVASGVIVNNYGTYTFQPGEALIFTVISGGPLPATTITVSGTYFTTFVTALPFTFSFEDIPVFNSLTAGSSINTVIWSAKCVNRGVASNICPIFLDGRLNDCDAGETAAVYCEKDGSVKVLSIYASKGYPAFVASPTEIAAVPSKPTANTLIKSGNGAFLYRLTSGELQVNRAEDGTGNIYKFIFKDCPKS